MYAINLVVVSIFYFFFFFLSNMGMGFKPRILRLIVHIYGKYFTSRSW